VHRETLIDRACGSTGPTGKREKSRGDTLTGRASLTLRLSAVRMTTAGSPHSPAPNYSGGAAGGGPKLRVALMAARRAGLTAMAVDWPLPVMLWPTSVREGLRGICLSL
jgi:hypothetical protein